MKSAAVIGPNSMLGAALVARLEATGADVITVGRFPEADIGLDLDNGFLSPIPGDTHSEVIFHCAAAFADDSLKSIRQNFQTNTAGCLWVLELAEHLKSKSIVYAGSLSSIKSLDPKNFTSYGLTKRLAEELLDWGMKRLNGRFCSLRFSQIYDTSGACIRHQPWFGRIIAYAARGMDINMPKSDGGRNFLHLDDAVRMMVVAETSSISGIFDVVHPEILTYEEIAGVAYRVFGKGGKVRIAPDKPPFRLINFPDQGEIYQLLGAVPEASIENSISRIRDQDTWPAFGPLDVS